MSEQRIILESKSLDNHFQDLYSLVKNTVILSSLTGILWSIFATEILTEWVSLFTIEYNTGDLSIYAPFNWVEVKWSFSILMGVITAIPFISLMLYNFAKPGLYPNETSPVKSILIVNAIFLPLVIFGIWAWMVPEMVDIADELSKIDNLEAQYDIFEIVNLALGITWMAVISSILSTSLLLARIMDDSGGIYDWLRPRIILISFGLLVFTMPSVFEGLRMPISMLILYLCDLFSRLFPIWENRPHSTKMSLH